jgi:hypothetical protein
MRMDRFFEILNTPIAVLSVLFVVVAVNVFLYFGYYSSKTPSPLPTEPTTPSATTLEYAEPSSSHVCPRKCLEGEFYELRVDGVLRSS